MRRQRLLTALLAAVLVGAAVLPVSAVGSSNPTTVSGNPTCKSIKSEGTELKVDPVKAGVTVITGKGLPAGASVTLDVSKDKKTVSWSSVGVAMADVLVKGGPAANRWTYSPLATEDDGLQSPRNPGGQIPTISHLVFCWVEGPIPNVFIQCGAAPTDVSGTREIEDIAEVPFYSLIARGCEGEKSFIGDFGYVDERPFVSLEPVGGGWAQFLEELIFVVPSALAKETLHYDDVLPFLNDDLREMELCDSDPRTGDEFEKDFELQEDINPAAVLPGDHTSCYLVSEKERGDGRVLFTYIIYSAQDGLRTFK